MLRKYKEKWLAALRSGEYEKIKGKMHQPGSNCFCANGVLSDIIISENSNMEWAPVKKYPKYAATLIDGKQILLSDVSFPVEFKRIVEEPLGIGESFIVMYNNRRTSVRDLNDDYELSFEQIADIIEEQIPETDYIYD